MPGETRNCAPASSASSAWPGVATVPAPTRISGTSAAIARSRRAPPACAASARSPAAPPATSARASGTAWSSVVEHDDRDHRRRGRGSSSSGHRRSSWSRRVTPGRRWRPRRPGRRWRGTRRTARGRCRVVRVARPVAGRRACRGRGRRAASSRPASASTRITSPSRTRASGPPTAASGVHVDRRRHLAGRAGHAAVGDERDLVAAVLQHAERRRQLVQLGHAVGAPGPGSGRPRRSRASSVAGLERGEEVAPGRRRRAPAPRPTRCSGSTAEILITARPRCRRAPAGRRRARTASSAPAQHVGVVGCASAPSLPGQLAAASSAGSSRVAPQAVAGDGLRRRRAAARRRAARRSANAMPPAAWKWFTSAAPFG